MVLINSLFISLSSKYVLNLNSLFTATDYLLPDSMTRIYSSVRPGASPGVQSVPYVSAGVTATGRRLPSGGRAVWRGSPEVVTAGRLKISVPGCAAAVFKQTSTLIDA